MINLRPHRRSEYALFKRCERAYFLRKMAGHQGGNAATRRGVGKHAILESALTGDMPESEQDKKAWSLVAPWVVDGKAEQKFWIDRDGLRVPDRQQAFMETTIDVETPEELIDYKTGASGFDTDFSDPDFLFQALWYAVCYDMGDAVSFRFLFPYQEPESGVCRNKKYRFSEQELREAFLKTRHDLCDLEELAQNRGTGEENWPVNPAACGNCLMADHCSFFKQEVQMDTQITRWQGGITSQNLPKAVEFLALVTQMQKKAEASIKDFIQENGNQKIGDEFYGAYTKESTQKSVDLHKLFEAVPLNEILEGASMTLKTLEVIAAKHGADPETFVVKSKVVKNYFGWVK